jgi:hypothetical protein
MRTINALRVFLFLVLVAPFDPACPGATPVREWAARHDDAVQGRELIRRFIEMNRYWLIGPPVTVETFAYAFSRAGETQRFVISDPARAPRSRLQGITYSTMLHALAAHPEGATVIGVDNEGTRLRLTLKFSPGVRGAFGNGVEGTWSGYHTVGGEEGQLLLDPVRLVPEEVRFGRLHEVFGDYVELTPGHFVPLSISLGIEERRYHWRFRVHKPGLWLFDRGQLNDQELARLSEVTVNGAETEPLHVLESSLALEKTETAGRERLELLLNANRNWLLPSIAIRRGLIYEYRQEAPYLERVWFGPEGQIMVRLEASRESPDAPTRQRLWLPDGRRCSASAGDSYIRIEEPSGETQGYPETWVRLDRHVHGLAMGLGLDCALMQAARDPADFSVEVRPADAPDQYLLVLRLRQDARLFTGTMLMFTSWAYMHDVQYQRAEILCDAATHRPIEERDYDSKGQLKGHYQFDQWIPAGDADAPGVIRALIPHEKDGRDQSLEMTAAFDTLDRGIWLLNRVESRFKGDRAGSTGTVAVITLRADETSFEPLRAFLDAVRQSEEAVQSIRAADEAAVSVRAPAENWVPLPLKAAWAEKARDAATFGTEKAADPMPPLVIGIRRARLSLMTAGAILHLEGLSTAFWKEFQTEWIARLLDGRGNVLAASATNRLVRAEGAPASFEVQLEMGFPGDQTPLSDARLALEGRVLRLTGAYHGHGVWMSLSREE